MKKTHKPIDAEAIAELADQGQDVSAHFSNRGTMIPAIQRVNVDLNQDMLKELDATATELNISRQAVIKTFLRQALDRTYLAKQARRTG